MKIVEITPALTLPVTNEEYTVFRRISKDERTPKNELTPREQLLANQLVNKDVLTRINEDGKIYYRKKQTKGSNRPISN